MYKYQQLKDKLWSLYGIYATPTELIEIAKSITMSKDPKFMDLALKSVCDTYGISIEEIKSKSRETPLPEARKVFCFLASIPLFSHSKIGKKINRDHSTVWVHIKEVEENWPKVNKVAIMRLNLAAKMIGLPEQLKFVKAGSDL